MKMVTYGICYLCSMSVFSMQVGVSIQPRKESEERVSDLLFLQKLIEHPQEITSTHTTSAMESAFHAMVGDPQYHKKASLQLKYIQQVQMAPDFTKMAVVTGAQVQLYALSPSQPEQVLPEQEVPEQPFQHVQTIDLSAPITAVCWEQDAQRMLIVYEQDTARAGAWYHMVGSDFFYEKDAETHEIEYQESRVLPAGIPPTSDQVVWSKRGEYGACLRNKFDVDVYQATSDGTYKKIETIPYLRKKITLIRHIYATETLSKIIVRLNNHTIVVYQRIVDALGALRFYKTQEIQSEHIMDMALSPAGDLLCVRTIGNSIDLYQVRALKQLSLYQMLVLPALQKCLAHEGPHAWIDTNKKLITVLIEDYAELYGEWLSDAWAPVVYRSHPCKNFVQRHKKWFAGVTAVVTAAICLGLRVQQ